MNNKQVSNGNEINIFGSPQDQAHFTQEEPDPNKNQIPFEEKVDDVDIVDDFLRTTEEIEKKAEKQVAELDDEAKAKYEAEVLERYGIKPEDAQNFKRTKEEQELDNFYKGILAKTKTNVNTENILNLFGEENFVVADLVDPRSESSIKLAEQISGFKTEHAQELLENTMNEIFSYVGSKQYKPSEQEIADQQASQEKAEAENIKAMEARGFKNVKESFKEIEDIGGKSPHDLMEIMNYGLQVFKHKEKQKNVKKDKAPSVEDMSDIEWMNAVNSDERVPLGADSFESWEDQQGNFNN